MANIEQIGHAFANHYYTLFDSNRGQLVGLYKNESKMSYENENFVGTQQIMQKLMNGMKFQKVAHNIKSIDCQPSGCAGSIVVFITGELKVDNESNAVMFTQAFHLMPDPGSNGNYWCHNDIFRLNYA